MTETAKTARSRRALLPAQVLQAAEIVGVFTIGGLVLLGGLVWFGRGPVSSIGSIWAANLVMLLAIGLGLRSRRQGWEHLGLKKDMIHARTIGWIAIRSIPTFFFAIFAFAVGAVIMANVFGVPEPADMSKYDYLRGNLGLTLLALGSVYVVSAFAEEVIYRGYLITRIEALCRNHGLAKSIAVVLSAIVFGLIHSEWGIPGMAQASFMGLALGVAFLVFERNVWVVILAHAYMDTILILQMYLA